MLFRPEEIHSASSVRPVFHPFPQRDCNITHYSRGFDFHDIPIREFHGHGIAAIQTHSINSDGLPRKQPANCQRFKSSLTKPFLLAVNGDPVLSRDITEGRKGCNQTRIGVEPTTGNPEVDEFMESLSALFRRYSQILRNVRVVGCVTSVHQPPHDDLECFAMICWIAHKAPPNSFESVERPLGIIILSGIPGTQY
jgi:hypothetical protein